MRERLDQAWATALTLPHRASRALYRRARYTDLFRVLGKMGVVWGILVFAVVIIVYLIVKEE